MFIHTCVGGGSELRTYFPPPSCLGCYHCVIRAFVFGLPTSSISLDNMGHMQQVPLSALPWRLQVEWVSLVSMFRGGIALAQAFSLFPC